MIGAKIKDKIIFTTRELALELNKNHSSISRSLNSLATQGDIVRVTRGLWANPSHPYFTPYALVPSLLNFEQGYVSFLSALHRHNAISQIPQVIQLATSGRNRTLKSSVGEFEFIHLNPVLMRSGFETWGDRVTYNLAHPDKALFDCLYISTRKGKRFTSFPELDLKAFKIPKLRKMIKAEVKSQPIQKAMLERLAFLLSEKGTF